MFKVGLGVQAPTLYVENDRGVQWLGAILDYGDAGSARGSEYFDLELERQAN